MFWFRFQINLDKIVGVNLACSHVQYVRDEHYAYNMSSSFMTGLKYHLLKIPLYRDDPLDEGIFLPIIVYLYMYCYCYVFR